MESYLTASPTVLYFLPGTGGRILFNGFSECIQQPRSETCILVDPRTNAVGIGMGGVVQDASDVPSGPYRVIGMLPPLYPEWLGDRGFLATHRLRFSLLTGEMATGIASEALVIAAARAGFLGFFGAGGLSPQRVEKALATIASELSPQPHSWGTNLIHSPHDPALEDALVDLYLRRGVERVSASAFMEMSPAVVRFSAAGLERGTDGSVVRRNHLFAKISRPEVARHFLAPAPAEVLRSLVEKGKITALQAEMAQRVPVAENITVEADSGGHTDNRPLISLLPVVRALGDRLAAEYGYRSPLRIGAAGGLGTPSSVAAAYSMGAAYVMTGSANQCAWEAGTSLAVKQMLSQAQISDFAMAPSADMFELGVKVQVLKRGTLFAARATQLHEVYRGYSSWTEVPAELAARIEEAIFRQPFEDVWRECVAYWTGRSPKEIVRAETDAKHKMALVFRWYLWNSAAWARNGAVERRMDYQIWCGPAIGAFNDWVAGSFLADPANRTVAQIGFNLLEGAACVTRAQQLRTAGVPVPASDFNFRPRPLS